MAAIDSVQARPAPLPQRTPAQAVQHASVEEEPASSTAAMRRTGLHHPSVLHQALSMSDDLAGLVSSMRRNRGREADDGDVRTHAWLDHVLDPKAPQKLSTLRLQLQALRSADAASIRALLIALFPDPSDAVAVLRTLLADADLEALKEALKAAEQELLSEPGAGGRALRAGLNCALKARLSAHPLRASARQLRQSYREFLEGGDPLDLYEEWIALYGFDRRNRVVDFIDQALAADMYALDPSCTRLEFGQLLQRVRQITTLRSADFLLMACCWNPSLMARIGVDASTLLSAMFTMVRHGGGLRDLFDNVFAQVRHALASGDKSLFAQSLRRFVKAVPHGLWLDTSLQLQALDEIEAMLDGAMKHEQRQPGANRWVAV